MKLSTTAFVLLCITTTVFAGLFFLEKKENAILRWKLAISDEAEKLNEDQIRDMEFELSSAANRRTYEEGFADALTRKEGDPQFTDAYVRGYHQAIGQNAEQLQRSNTKLAELEKMLKEAEEKFGGQIAEQSNAK